MVYVLRSVFGDLCFRHEHHIDLVDRDSQQVAICRIRGLEGDFDQIICYAHSKSFSIGRRQIVESNMARGVRSSRVKQRRYGRTCTKLELAPQFHPFGKIEVTLPSLLRRPHRTPDEQPRIGKREKSGRQTRGGARQNRRDCSDRVPHIQARALILVQRVVHHQRHTITLSGNERRRGVLRHTLHGAQNVDRADHQTSVSCRTSYRECGSDPSAYVISQRDVVDTTSDVL